MGGGGDGGGGRCGGGAWNRKTTESGVFSTRQRNGVFIKKTRYIEKGSTQLPWAAFEEQWSSRVMEAGQRAQDPACKGSTGQNWHYRSIKIKTTTNIKGTSPLNKRRTYVSMRI